MSDSDSHTLLYPDSVTQTVIHVESSRNLFDNTILFFCPCKNAQNNAYQCLLCVFFYSISMLALNNGHILYSKLFCIISIFCIKGFIL